MCSYSSAVIRPLGGLVFSLVFVMVPSIVRGGAFAVPYEISSANGGTVVRNGAASSRLHQFLPGLGNYVTHAYGGQQQQQGRTRTSRSQVRQVYLTLSPLSKKKLKILTAKSLQFFLNILPNFFIVIFT